MKKLKFLFNLSRYHFMWVGASLADGWRKLVSRSRA